MYQVLYEPIYEPETPETVERVTFTNNFLIYRKSPINEIEWIFTPEYGNPNGEKLRIPFVRIEPNINEFVNRILIAGQYTDEQGRRFIFKESGEAVWPDKSFKYKVGLDRIFTKCDYIFIHEEKDENGMSKSYGFEWNDNRLLLYSVHYNPEKAYTRELEEEPLYILTP